MEEKEPAMVDKGEHAVTWEALSVIVFIASLLVIGFVIGRATAPTSDRTVTSCFMQDDTYICRNTIYQ
jgi:hypothetical protein